jgi:hypothetical protein
LRDIASVWLSGCKYWPAKFQTCPIDNSIVSFQNCSQFLSMGVSVNSMKEENDAMKFTFCKSFPFVLLAAFALPAVAQDLEWELVNDTQSDLVEMYTSPANMGTWREVSVVE